MKIKISNPEAINQIGGRSNNEDSIYPLLENATKNNKLFLVCDGVGGNEKGEVASRLACDKIAEYFKQNPIEAISEAYIAEALKYTESAFDQYFEDHPESRGMGTTLTLLNFHKSGATIAHIGDSRVYQFRNGQIIFQTSDHSLVNDLLKAGVLNEKQAKDHPKKNVISRAIQGTTVKATKADVEIITDIQTDDYFFLCTDGILENITDFEIGQILVQDISNADKMEQIRTRCEESPNDNFSAYLIQIENTEGITSIIQEEILVEAIVDEPETEVIAEPEIEEQKPKGKSLFLKHKKILPIILIAFGFIIITFWYVNQKTKEKSPVQKMKILDNKLISTEKKVLKLENTEIALPISDSIVRDDSVLLTEPNENP